MLLTSLINQNFPWYLMSHPKNMGKEIILLMVQKSQTTHLGCFLETLVNNGRFSIPTVVRGTPRGTKQGNSNRKQGRLDRLQLGGGERLPRRFLIIYKFSLFAKRKVEGCKNTCICHVMIFCIYAYCIAHHIANVFISPSVFSLKHRRSATKVEWWSLSVNHPTDISSGVCTCYLPFQLLSTMRRTTPKQLRFFGWVSVILQEIVLKNGYTMELSRGFPFVQLFGKQHAVSKDCFCMWLSQTQRDFEIAKDP